MEFLQTFVSACKTGDFNLVKQTHEDVMKKDIALYSWGLKKTIIEGHDNITDYLIKKNGLRHIPLRYTYKIFEEMLKKGQKKRVEEFFNGKIVADEKLVIQRLFVCADVETIRYIFNKYTDKYKKFWWQKLGDTALNINNDKKIELVKIISNKIKIKNSIEGVEKLIRGFMIDGSGEYYAKKTFDILKNNNEDAKLDSRLMETAISWGYNEWIDILFDWTNPHEVNSNFLTVNKHPKNPGADYFLEKYKVYKMNKEKKELKRSIGSGENLSLKLKTRKKI